jgi:hypothetical protein
VATANARAESSVTLHPIKKTEIKTRIARIEKQIRDGDSPCGRPPGHSQIRITCPVKERFTGRAEIPPDREFYWGKVEIMKPNGRKRPQTKRRLIFNSSRSAAAV